MYSAVSGNIGIGLNAPDRKLHIGNGMLRIDRDGNSAGILLHRYYNVSPLKAFLLGVNASSEDNGYFFIGDNYEAVGDTPDMRWVINSNGVEIGSQSAIINLGFVPLGEWMFLNGLMKEIIGGDNNNKANWL